MIQVNRADLLSALMVQAVKDVRYYLNAVFIDDKNHIVATDGHRMFVGKAEANGETALIALKSKPPAKFDYAEISVEGKTISYFIKDEMQSSALVEIVDGRFPNWRRVANIEVKPTEGIGMNMVYLADAAKCAKLFNKHDGAIIETSGTAGAVRIKFTPEAFMVIMPMRVKL